MKKLITYLLGLVFIIALAGCKGCSNKEKEQFLTTESTPPSQTELTFGDGFFGDCSMAKTGSSSLFDIKVKVRGISGYDATGTPSTYVYRSYIWPGVSNAISNYLHNIDIPNTGGYFIDVSIESNGCVKCCTGPTQTNCPANFGNIELFASKLINATVTVPTAIALPASIFTKTCY
jgi:hypothetical protein